MRRSPLPGATDVPYVLTAVETLGDTFAAGWRITARSASGKRDAGRSPRECVYTRELDLETLVWTRGPNFRLWQYFVARSASTPEAIRRLVELGLQSKRKQ